MYFIIFTEHNKKCCLSLHYNKGNRSIFVNGKKIHKFKAKVSAIKATALCTGSISYDFFVDNMKNTGFHGYVYCFCVDYDAAAVDDILDD